MPRAQKGQRFGGRPKGAKNKATIEREVNAAQVIDRARKEGRDLAVTVLERLMNVAEGACGLNRPVPAKDLAAGAKENPDGDWGRFGEWFDRTAYCAKELAKYQSPQLKAIAVMEAPQVVAPVPHRAGDNVVYLDDPAALGRVYSQMVKRIA
ncbi:hypothetical protein [Bradyrhizobium sp.]